MPSISKPNLTSYGDSFSKYTYGNRIDETLPRGDIKSDELLKSNQTDEVEFNLFYKEVRDFVLASLGHPIVRVELSDFQLKIIIEQAISKLNFHAPLWMRQFAVFNTEPNVGIYELPPWIIQNLTYVAYKKSLINTNYPPESFQSDMMMNYFKDNFAFGDFSIGEFYLLQSWLESFKRVIGADGTWEIVNGQYLQLYPCPSFAESVVLEYLAMDSNTMHPAYRSWIQRYALAIAKEVVGQIRSKYKIMPSPGGGAQLNGKELITESKEEKKVLEEELINELEEPPTPTWF
jgi:hypothetical protein